MNPHTPKWVPILGIGILMDSQILEKNFKGQNSLIVELLTPLKGS
jgi:hypothetical protein